MQTIIKEKIKESASSIIPIMIIMLIIILIIIVFFYYHISKIWQIYKSNENIDR